MPGVLRRAVVGALVLGSAMVSVPAAAASTLVSTARGSVTAVASVDLTRYVGTWYQVAAIPAIFEVQCAKNATAEYVANADGTVGVTNRCSTWTGGTSTVRGTARIDNPPANSRLTVSFVSLFSRPIYLGGTNYVVIGLDTDYRWAVVTDPRRLSGFVLSRTPALSAPDTATVTAIIKANGFAAGTFRYTPQDGGKNSRGPLR